MVAPAASLLGADLLTCFCGEIFARLMLAGRGGCEDYGAFWTGWSEVGVSEGASCGSDTGIVVI